MCLCYNASVFWDWKNKTTKKFIVSWMFVCFFFPSELWLISGIFVLTACNQLDWSWSWGNNQVKMYNLKRKTKVLLKKMRLVVIPTLLIAKKCLLGSLMLLKPQYENERKKPSSFCHSTTYSLYIFFTLDRFMICQRTI